MADLIRRPITHHAGLVEGRRIPDQQLTQYIPPGFAQITDSVTLRQSRSLAVVRDGGLGDMLLLTPVLRALKDLYPHVDIHLFTKPPYLPLFEHNPHVDTLYPLNHYQKFAFDEVVDLQQFVEKAPDTGLLDRASLFASAFGIELKDGELEYTVTADETDWAVEWLEAQGVGGQKIMALAPWATDPRRSWEVQHARRLVELMGECGWQTIVFHNTDDADDFFGDVAVCCVEPSLREKAAILGLMDMVVSVDTGIYHLAMAARAGHPQDLPFVVVLFGLIPPALRMRWYSNCMSLIAEEIECCPCCENPELLTTCTRECMRALTGERVFEQIHRVADFKAGGRNVLV